MNKLKVFCLPHYAVELGEFTRSEFYLKSEADKVISELKAQKAQAEEDCAYWKMSEGNAVNAMNETEEYAMQLYKELRHQKYKRCLAMAEMCEARYDEEDAKVIIGIDGAKGKDFTGFYRFGFGGELIVNDEMDDVSDCAKDKAKKLIEAK